MNLTTIAACLTLPCCIALAASDELITSAADKYSDLTDHTLARMVKRTKEVISGTDGGCELSVFLSENRVRKLLLKTGLSNRIVEQHFYYRKGQLILIIDRELFFKFDEQAGTFDLTQLGGRHEERYYFADGKLQYVISRRDAGAFGREERDKKEIDGLKELSTKLLEVGASNEETIDLETYFKTGK